MESTRDRPQKECEECLRPYSAEKRDSRIDFLIRDWDSSREDMEPHRGKCISCSSFCCSICGDTKVICEEGSKPLYAGVCIDCTRCKFCDSPMWWSECTSPVCPRR